MMVARNIYILTAGVKIASALEGLRENLYPNDGYPEKLTSLQGLAIHCGKNGELRVNW